jgi:hypothetical protein
LLLSVLNVTLNGLWAAVIIKQNIACMYIISFVRNGLFMAYAKLVGSEIMCSSGGALNTQER